MEQGIEKQIESRLADCEYFYKMLCGNIGGPMFTLRDRDSLNKNFAELWYWIDMEKMVNEHRVIRWKGVHKNWLKDHPETEKIVKEGLKKSKLRQIDEI